MIINTSLIVIGMVIAFVLGNFLAILGVGKVIKSGVEAMDALKNVIKKQEEVIKLNNELIQSYKELLEEKE